MGISMDKAQFISLYLESIMYGGALIMCCITVMVLFRVRAEGGLADTRLMTVLSSMMIVATVHIIVSFVRAIDAFLFLAGSPKGGTVYFENFKNALYIVKDSCFIIQTALGDAVNVWRCFVVWGRRLPVIVAPVIMMIGGVVSASLSLATAATLSPGTTIFTLPKRWITAGAVLMMCTNVYCTAAICFKIYKSGHYQASFSNLLPVLVVIVETGSIYTAALLAFLGTYLSGSNGQYVALDLITPLVPSIFCLIILQIKFHRSDLSSHERSSDGRRVSRFFSNMRRTQADRRTEISLGTYPNPVAVQITTEAEEHFPGEPSFRTGSQKNSYVEDSKLVVDGGV